MRNRIMCVGVVVMLAYLHIAVPAGQAQEKCTLQTIAGTYVFHQKGSSSIVELSLQPFPLHWAGTIAPFLTVSEITFTPDGIGHGYYWIMVGSLNGGVDPIPVVATITEMNENCTGKFTYAVTLPDLGTATMQERFILFDNGREFRSIPTSIQDGIPTLAWIGTGHRIRKFGEPVTSCGPHTAQGSYLLSTANLVRNKKLGPTPTTAFADTLLLHIDVSMTGDYTGMLYEKLGPVSVELPVSGTITVSPDCSFSNNLNIQNISGTFILRGVYFNEGKKLYGLVLQNTNSPPDDQGVKSSFVHGTRIGP